VISPFSNRLFISIWAREKTHHLSNFVQWHRGTVPLSGESCVIQIDSVSPAAQCDRCPAKTMIIGHDQAVIS
jgi:hypothetical protein